MKKPKKSLAHRLASLIKRDAGHVFITNHIKHATVVGQMQADLTAKNADVAMNPSFRDLVPVMPYMRGHNWADDFTKSVVEGVTRTERWHPFVWQDTINYAVVFDRLEAWDVAVIVDDKERIVELWQKVVIIHGPKVLLDLAAKAK